MSLADALRVGSQVDQGRFELTRILARGTAGLLFQARAPRDPRNWVLKEIEPATAVDDQLSRMESVRLRRVSPACGSVTHQGRRFLVHEYVEGIPVQTLARLGRRPLRRDEVLREALRLVEDLAHLQRAGVALSERILTPEHVVVDAEGHLRPVNAIPSSAERTSGASGSCSAARVAARLGELVALLLAPPDRSGSLPPDVAWFVARCRSGPGQASYQDLDQLASALRELLPEEARLPQGPQPRDPGPRPPSRPSRWRWAALVLLAVPAFLMGVSLRPATMPTAEREALVGYADRVEVLDADTFRPLRTLREADHARSLVLLPGGLLLAALPSGPAFLSPLDGGLHPTSPPGMAETPESVAVDPEGRWLALALPGPGLVKVKPVRAAVERALGSQAFGRKSEERMAAASGKGVHMALGVSEKGGVPPLYLSEPERGMVSRVDLEPGRLVGETPVAGPGPLLLSPGGRQLYVACPSSGQVLLLDARTVQRLQRYRSPGGSAPVALAMGPGGDEVWVLLESGSLVALGAADLAPRATLDLGLKPGPAHLAMEEGVHPRLWVASVDEVLAVDPVRGRVARRVPLRGRPLSLAVGAAGGGLEAAAREAAGTVGGPPPG